MKKRSKAVLSFVLLTAMLAMILPAGAAFADEAAVKEYYVAVNGSDDNDGSVDAPFATLEKARDTIRAQKKAGGLPEGGIRVYLREGTYLRTKPFSLTKDDSGTQSSPITYGSYPGEKAVLTAGYTLDASEFKQVMDKAALDQIPKAAQKKVYQFDLKSIGVTSFPEVKPYGWGYSSVPPEMQVYYNGNLMTNARYPNEDFLETGMVKDKGLMTGEVGGDFTKGGATFYYDDDVIGGLAGSEDEIMMFGYWRFGWATNNMKVDTIDTKEKTVTLLGPTGYGVEAGQPYYVYNSLRLLDDAGEFYIDRENAVLFMVPDGEIKSATIQLSKESFDLVKLVSVSNVTLADLGLSMTLGNGVYVSEGSNLLVRGCDILKIGGNGVTVIANNKDSGRIGVIDSEIHDIGNTGIDITAGNRKNLLHGECFAYNNKIHNFGVVTKVYEPGINLSGCGNIAKYNEIYDGPHQAIAIDGNDQVVEYNNVYDVVKVSNDTGAIYSYGQNSYLGFQINNNYWHDIHSTAEIGAGIMAIYMDDFISGATITGNIIDNVNNTGIFVKHKNLTIKHNIIRGSSRAIYLSDFDVGRTDSAQSQYQTSKSSGFMSDLWNKAYPFWPDIYAEAEADKPTGNVVVDNVIIGGQEKVETYWAGELTNTIGNKNMSEDEVGFVDAAGGNFNLKDDAGIFKKIADFPKPEFDKMGMYQSRFDAVNKNQVSLKAGSPIAFAKGTKTKVDPANPNVMPNIIDGRTLVPVRFISESFGAEIAWEGETATATVALDGKTIKLTLGSNTMDVDGAAVTLDVPAQSIEGRTMVPLRALVEALGKKVFWDDRGLISIGESETPFDGQPELLEALLYQFR